MKTHFCLIVCFALALTACTAEKKQTEEPADSGKQKTADTTAGSDTLPAAAHPVFGYVTHALIRCPDGANYPGRENGGKVNQGALAGYRLYFRAGTTNDTMVPVADSAVTDANGRYRVALAPGTYMILLREQLLPYDQLLKSYAGTRYQVRPECLQQWWTQPRLLFTVTEKTLQAPSLELVFNENTPVPCPCISFPCNKPRMKQRPAD